MSLDSVRPLGRQIPRPSVYVGFVVPLCGSQCPSRLLVHPSLKSLRGLPLQGSARNFTSQGSSPTPVCESDFDGWGFYRTFRCGNYV